ncbi:MAG: hypothetical protein ACYTEP_12305 [Planctomycetota bacterium]|jgi:hypothetical protein
MNGSPFPSEASVALAASFSGPEVALQELRVRARTAAERLHTNASVEELEPLQAELELTVGAIAALPGAAALPWQEWIENSRFSVPELTEQELLAATRILEDPEAIALARTCDFREMPGESRLIAHEVFWRVDPNEAYARGRTLLFREHIRARDRMRRIYVEELLITLDHPMADEMLLDVATEDSMEPRARVLAVRSLKDRGNREAPAILESLFDTEATNFLVRKEALLAILALDPPRGHKILMEKMPSRAIDPGTWEFMRTLREQEGLPLPADD